MSMTWLNSALTGQCVVGHQLGNTSVHICSWENKTIKLSFPVHSLATAMNKIVLYFFPLLVLCEGLKKPRNIIVLLGDDIGWNEVRQSK